MPGFLLKLPFKIIMISLFMMCSLDACAQSWLPGFNYRKKITIKKSLVTGNVNLTDFQLLVSLEDPDLSYVAGRCSGNKISNTKGLDFAFTLVSSPATPLNYQLDCYEPGTGKLISWVKLASLAASGTSTPATEIYLYYGSNTIHFPDAADAHSTWNQEVSRVWHMNTDASSNSIRNATSKLQEESLIASSNITGSSYVPGKIGNAVNLNGINQSFSSSKETNLNFYISCWIKLSVNNREQIIVTSDSTLYGGFVFKINEKGQPVLETRINSLIIQKTAPYTLLTNQWYNISALHQQGKRGFYINGVYYSTTVSSGNSRAGGQIVVGRNKEQQSHFDGTVDELRIQSAEPGENWVKTAYNNQKDPAAFYTVSAQQNNSVINPTGILFTGLVNEHWSEPGNWSIKEVPGNFEQIILQSGSKSKLNGMEAFTLNSLILEAGATFETSQNMEVLCKTAVSQDGKIFIGPGSNVQFDGDVFNDGRIESTSSGGRITFSGSNVNQAISGSGEISVYGLLIDQAAKANTVKLEQPAAVSGFVRAIQGTLNSNGYLTLKHNGTSSAFLWPVADLNTASVTGEVTVEQYVPGVFPEPASARGWRLLSSPVFHGSGADGPYYHLYDFKQCIFVTGPGGSANGFDASPQNGHTIYTHNQSTVGSLSQKYSGIPQMNTSVSLSKGIYVFSRGGRNAPDAFVKQVQVAPFQNPAAYVINHKGILFQGALEVELQNRNMAEAGDGFNLLGNPYAAALRWGDLEKEQTGPYIWKFNPLNNAYDVSDDPNTIIAAGEGFFVKVLDGFAQGRLNFREEAKYTGTVSAELAALPDQTSNAEQNSAVVADRKIAALKSDGQRTTSKLKLTLSRGDFQQAYSLVLDPSGNDALDDQDAASLGTGYVSIAGLAPGGARLSVESRATPGRRPSQIPIYVKGWTTGSYNINITGVSTLPPGDRLILVDNYLRIRQDIKEDQTYSFELNTAIAESYGEHRFSLIIQAAEQLSALPGLVNFDVEPEILFYPNPFKEYLELKLPPMAPVRMGLRIRDLMGQLILRLDLGLVNGQEPVTVNTSALATGPYLLELINLDNHQRIKATKIIKQ